MAMAGGIQENPKKVIMALINNYTKEVSIWILPFFYTPIQEVIPKVVAIAVNTVMTMLMIFPQMFLFIVMSFKL